MPEWSEFHTEGAATLKPREVKAVRLFFMHKQADTPNIITALCTNAHEL